MDNSDRIIIKPKTYLDRLNIVDNAKYVFISYSHASSESVYNDLQLLYDRGLNYWYDINLKSGQEWNKTVKEIISNEKCCGIIFFFDENSLNGDAVEQEILLCEELKKTRPDMFSFCLIAPEDESIYKIVCKKIVDIMYELKDLHDVSKELQERLPETRVVSVLTAFRKEKLFKLRQGNYINELIEDVRSYSPLAISDATSDVENAVKSFGGKLKLVNDHYELTFGVYPQNITLGPFDRYISNSLGMRSVSKVIMSGGEKFAMEPIIWVLEQIDNGKACFIAKDILDATTGERDEIEQWTKNFFNLAFVGCGIEVGGITIELPSVADVEKISNKIKEIKTTCYAQTKLSVTIYTAWLSDTSGQMRKTFFNSNDSLGIDFDYFDSLCGIVPKLIINIKELMENTNGKI